MPESKSSNGHTSHARGSGSTATENGGVVTGAGVREVFLSPRVVDREAFNDFSGSLRRLIEGASGQGEALKIATEQAAAAHQQLRDLATKHTARFEAAAKAMSSLDEKAGKAETMLAQAQAAAASLENFRVDAQRVVGEQTATIERAMESLLMGFAGRLESAVTAATQRLEQSAIAAEERVAGACARAEERASASSTRAEERASAASARAEVLGRQIEAFATTADQKLAEARQTISGYEARGVQSVDDAAAGARRSFDGVCELLSRHAEELRLSLAAGADVHRERIDQYTESALSRSREAASGLARAADAAESRVAKLCKETQVLAEEQKRHLSDMLFRAEEAAGEVEALVGLATALPDDGDEAACTEAAGLALPGSLADVILKARLHRARAEAAMKSLDETSTKAEAARRELGDSITDGAAKIDALSNKADSLRRELAESMHASEEAVMALAGRRAEAEEIVREPLAVLRGRSEQVRTQISALETQSQKAREVSDQVVERTTTIVRGLSGLLSELKPWQGILLESDPAAPIPPALRGVIDQIRSEIAGDLATIATGLQHVALRANNANKQG